MDGRKDERSRAGAAIWCSLINGFSLRSRENDDRWARDVQLRRIYHNADDDQSYAVQVADTFAIHRNRLTYDLWLGAVSDRTCLLVLFWLSVTVSEPPVPAISGTI